MDKKLTWNEIKSRYAGQWVELENAHWDSNRPFPKAATVRKASFDRSEVVAASRAAKNDSMVLFIGAPHATVQVEITANM